MNPLGLPWGRKPPVEEKDPVPVYLGLRNEAVKDNAKEEKVISISVRGLKGVPDGEYKLGWVEGAPLKEYLSKLKLTAAAMRSAVRDVTNPEAGRVRMHYIPAEGAHITLGSASVSSALHLQRSNHNAESIAQRMGGGARLVDIPFNKR